jgi:hypothetical protein
MFAFSEFCIMKFVGRHPCRDDGSASFFFLDVETFTSIIIIIIIILLLLLSNINVFSLLRPVPHFQKLHPARLSTRQEV